LADAHYTREELISILSGSISESVADAQIVRAATTLSISRDSFTLKEAQDILESIANEPGLVGIAARFAKSRVALRWKK
jgi:hypothetical protein